ncbi:MAG: hypothetical protein DI605_17775 [Sphingomonas sp.]|nr:MAG: hypothetical protein DI605_17775 [Sphingomonas sp.]
MESGRRQWHRPADGGAFRVGPHRAWLAWTLQTKRGVMIDPDLIFEEFTAYLAGNVVTAILVGLLMLAIAVAIPPRWKWWAAFPLAVVIGLCLTVAFIALGMPILYRLGATFEAHFGPIHLVIAMLVSGLGFAIVRKRRGPVSDHDMPKPDRWYDRP